MNRQLHQSSHLGFEEDVISASTRLNQSYQKVVANVEKKLKVYTSTPIAHHRTNTMDIVFSKCFDDVNKAEILSQDSGYVSQNLESNLDSTMDHASSYNNKLTKSDIETVYLGEDALLEKPELSAISMEVKKLEEEYEEFSHLYYLTNSIINPSQESVVTNFSGFDGNNSQISNYSDEICIVEPIILPKSNKIREKTKENNSVFSVIKNVTITDFPIQNCQSDVNIENNRNCVDTKNNSPSVNSEKLVFKLIENINEQLVAFCQPQNETSDVKTPVKLYKNPVNSNLSPDLFSDEEPTKTPLKLPVKQVVEDKYVTENERKLLKRIQKSLVGVLPPPSHTFLNMTTQEMLERIKKNEALFFWNVDASKSTSDCDNVKFIDKTSSETFQCTDNKKEVLTVLITSKQEDIERTQWPYSLGQSFHGLLYNKGTISEEIEHLCCKYAARYVGAETQSSLTIFGVHENSPSKRRFNRFRRTAKSPGKRLSHLARRRITFCKESCNTGGSNVFIANRTRQILVDARKLEVFARRKSPHKKTPKKTVGKSPRKRGRTPSSSAKKRLALRRSLCGDQLNEAVPSTSTKTSVTKRALFQSPEDGGSNSAHSNSSATSSTSISLRRRSPRRVLFTSPAKFSPKKVANLWGKTASKRALFTSPAKSTCSEDNIICDKKRKRNDSLEDIQINKFPRSLSFEVKPLSSKESKPKTLARPHSSFSLGSSQELSEHRKKKLLWAVAEALRSQNIGMTHPQFKTFASVLARVIRRLLPNLFVNGPRPEGSTSENMLRIARQHVFAVSRGKTLEEIVNEAEKTKMKLNKPSGYVGLEQNDPNKENLSQDKINIVANASSCSAVGSNRPTKVLDRRDENVERIRKIIDFGSDDDTINKPNR